MTEPVWSLSPAAFRITRAPHTGPSTCCSSKGVPTLLPAFHLARATPWRHRRLAIFNFIINLELGWGWSSVVEHLPSTRSPVQPKQKMINQSSAPRGADLGPSVSPVLRQRVCCDSLCLPLASTQRTPPALASSVSVAGAVSSWCASLPCSARSFSAS